VAIACALLPSLDEGKRLSDPRCKMRIWAQEADSQAQRYEETIT
jgi:hypothetical protein